MNRPAAAAATAATQYGQEEHGCRWDSSANAGQQRCWEHGRRQQMWCCWHAHIQPYLRQLLAQMQLTRPPQVQRMTKQATREGCALLLSMTCVRLMDGACCCCSHISDDSGEDGEQVTHTAAACCAKSTARNYMFRPHAHMSARLLRSWSAPSPPPSWRTAAR